MTRVNGILKISSKFLLISLLLFFILFSLPSVILGQVLEEPDIVAESAIIIEANQGKIIWEKNSGKKMFPASITKMLTAIIAIEEIDGWNEIIEISKNASGRNHSAFWFEEGDKIKLIDLLKSALICSHNNATIALAEHIAGSEEEFVNIMNKKAEEIGAVDTFFQNTNGLDSEFPYHKSTARDLALIAKYCMDNLLFRKIVNTNKDIIKINDEEFEINSTNKLLPYQFVKGIKTGLTNNAGFCLVTYSDKNGLELITVILNSGYKERENDALSLINYISENYNFEQIVEPENISREIEVGGINTTNVNIYPSASYIDLINSKKDEIEYEYEIQHNVGLPIEKDQELGNLNVYLNGNKVTDIPLVSKSSVSEPYTEQLLANNNDKKNQIILIVILSFYFFIFAFIMVRNFFFRKRYYL